MCRTILLTLALFVLAVAAVAAAPAPAAPQGGCAPSLEILTPGAQAVCKPAAPSTAPAQPELDRKSTRLNSSHVRTPYAVFCLQKTTRRPRPTTTRASASS